MKSINKINNEIRDIIYNDQLFEDYLSYTSEGLIICRKNSQIIYISNQCIGLLRLDEKKFPKKMDELFDGEGEKYIHEGGTFSYKVGPNILRVSIIVKKDFLLLIIQDFTKIEELKKKSSEVKQLNKELQAIYELYADDIIFITDGKGKVILSGAMDAAICGVSPNYMIGKSVYDLEKEKVFYPSVTVKVLESNQPEVAIQSTKDRKKLVAVATPLFDEEGNIVKVISITRDYSKQIKIGTLLSSIGLKQTDQIPDRLAKNIITCNEEMIDILGLANLVAKVNSTVLIYGETGTGKEVVARYIHNASGRADKPFIKVNCGAIAPSLVESELFGYEPGSFTGANKEGKIGLLEAANGGTLFLDEISELPLSQQVKILQVLQESSIIRIGGTKTIHLDIRVVAASNKKLRDLVAKGEFREDLFYRLNVVPINIPPLRERKEDIPILIKHFSENFEGIYGKEKKLSAEAFRFLCYYSWPGMCESLRIQ